MSLELPALSSSISPFVPSSTLRPRITSVLCPDLARPDRSRSKSVSNPMISSRSSATESDPANQLCPKRNAAGLGSPACSAAQSVSTLNVNEEFEALSVSPCRFIIPYAPCLEAFLKQPYASIPCVDRARLEASSSARGISSSGHQAKRLEVKAHARIAGQHICDRSGRGTRLAVCFGLDASIVYISYSDSFCIHDRS